VQSAKALRCQIRFNLEIAKASMGGVDIEGTLHISAEPEPQPLRALSVSERRRAVEVELQLARQRLECQERVGRVPANLFISNPFLCEGVGFVFSALQ